MGRLYNWIGVIFRLLGLHNVIIIEAERGTRENTQAVFEELLRRKAWDKYRFVLIADRPAELQQFVSRRVSVYQRPAYHANYWAHFRLFWKKLRAVMIIDENVQIRKKLSDTVHILLTHGSPVKSVHDYYNCTPDTDYMLSQSPFWAPINQYELRVPAEKLVTLGFPRNDALYNSTVSMEQLFGRSYRKVVVWYPTFRQHQRYGKQTSISLPVLHDKAAAERINAFAARYDILLIVKPHPAQDLSAIQAMELDHLKFIYDDFFTAHSMTAHAFLAKTDAMITDYSSIVFDYILTGKPIALTFEDYSEYKERVGFAIDMDILRACSTMLDTVEDFECFFRDLSEGNDPLREKREALMRLTNTYQDGNSTARVVDWMETLLPEKS